MTFYKSFADPDGKHRVLEVELYLEDADPKRRLHRVGVPASLMGQAGEHAITVRVGPGSLRLYIDGVLVDEEWPTAPFRRPLGAVTVDAARVREIVAFARA
ncbi:MAG TPA: hypothetical protein VK324_04175 [Tepidisphaeraceae bacterium]|nr:hypothetical protein [Tepidisphaeraceae bacterium]